ncbi:hypothetical protein DD238_008020 [Peronospora effusa]|uniref:Uncharacterized protein n=1 Tax=Peronospora effusa TaxID=542832 RepID=A0A3M6V794_9STRA|nr:hypothetical protein DD238_008020 [Peronospora effusa]
MQVMQHPAHAAKHQFFVVKCIAAGIMPTRVSITRQVAYIKTGSPVLDRADVVVAIED